MPHINCSKNLLFGISFHDVIYYNFIQIFALQGSEINNYFIDRFLSSNM